MESARASSLICFPSMASFGIKVADIYLADLIKEPAKSETEKPKPFPLPQEELERKAGNYRDERFGRWIVVSVDKGRLKAALSGREFMLTPTGPTT